MVAFFDGELINDQKFIIRGIVKVDQAGQLSLCITILTDFDINSFGQQAMKSQIVCHQVRCADLHHLFQGFLTLLFAKVRVQTLQGSTHFIFKDNLLIAT